MELPEMLIAEFERISRSLGIALEGLTVEELNWQPKILFKELIREMVESDTRELSSELYGTKKEQYVAKLKARLMKDIEETTNEVFGSEKKESSPEPFDFKSKDLNNTPKEFKENTNSFEFKNNKFI